jgi:hypothetical protein
MPRGRGERQGLGLTQPAVRTARNGEKGARPNDEKGAAARRADRLRASRRARCMPARWDRAHAVARLRGSFASGTERFPAGVRPCSGACPVHLRTPARLWREPVRCGTSPKLWPTHSAATGLSARRLAHGHRGRSALSGVTRRGGAAPTLLKNSTLTAGRWTTEEEGTLGATRGTTREPCQRIRARREARVPLAVGSAHSCRRWSVVECRIRTRPRSRP